MYKQGQIFDFSQYLQETARTPLNAVVWSWHDIHHECSSRPHSVDGTLALSNGDPIDRGTVAPGLSLVIQVLNPGESTKSHRHSFWHLYTVRSGRGLVKMDSDQSEKRIVDGDIVFVPAWCDHAIQNDDENLPLQLFRLQNLPQNASIGNLSREDDGRLRHIYAAKQR